MKIMCPPGYHSGFVATHSIKLKKTRRTGWYIIVATQDKYLSIDIRVY